MRSMLPAQHPRNTSRSCLSSVQVVGAIRHKRTSGQMDGEYKQLLGKLLRLHPDYYSMWNFRKEAVLAEVSAKRARLQEKRRRQREAKKNREPAKLFSRQCSASRALPFFSLSRKECARDLAIVPTVLALYKPAKVTPFSVPLSVVLCLSPPHDVDDERHACNPARPKS